jgi:hypothetical protein
MLGSIKLPASWIVGKIYEPPVLNVRGKQRGMLAHILREALRIHINLAASIWPPLCFLMSLCLFSIYPYMMT